MQTEALTKNFVFSFDNYIKMLSLIKKIGTLTDYSEITEHTDKFIILRHDVEFSPRRAYNLALLENQENISSTYFFQLTNNAYNILSGENITRLKEIHYMGHHIGLHFHLHGSNDLNEIKNRIKYECEILSKALAINIDRFSFHRPSSLVLENNIEIPGIINAYNPLYFTYVKDVADIDFQKHVKYIADSRNEWSYTSPWTYPCLELFEYYPKLQILCHPYSWCHESFNVLENLKSVIEENKREFINTLNNETKYVKDYINEL